MDGLDPCRRRRGGSALDRKIGLVRLGIDRSVQIASTRGLTRLVYRRATVACVRRRIELPRADLALAVAVAIGAQTEVFLLDLDPKVVVAPATLIASLMIALRRRSPLVAVFAAVALSVVESVAGVPANLPVAPVILFVIALYAVASYTDLGRAVAAFAFALAVIWGGILLRPHDLTDLPYALLVAGTPWLFGRAMRARVSHSVELAARLARVERESEEQAREAVADERARIARELHDVIAHSVSVMVVQAGAAEEVLRSSPERALDPLRSVQETGRAALVEMARLLQILRRDAEQLGFAPQPGLDDLDGLLAQTRAAGLSVDLGVHGEPRPLALGTDLCAYRIVQEALTNTRKHAGPAHVQVDIRYRTDTVEIEILDDGTSSANGAGGGHGLIGMSERVALFDGELEAGPTAQGGFRVRAKLPIESVA